MEARERALKLFEQAYECQRAGDVDGAIRLYRASIAEHPTAEAHTFLGWVYSFARRYDEAIAECKRAIEVDPTFGNPYNDIGVYLMALGRDDEAVPWLERAMGADRYASPHYPHLNLARIHEKRGRGGDALSELQHAQAFEPDDPSILREIRRLQGRMN